jgi:archaellum component FlaC
LIRYWNPLERTATVTTAYDCKSKIVTLENEMKAVKTLSSAAYGRYGAMSEILQCIQLHLNTVTYQVDMLRTSFEDFREEVRPHLRVLGIDVGEVKSEVSAMKPQVIELRVDMSQVVQDVSVLKKANAVLKRDVSVLREDVSDLKGDVSVLKGDVSDLKEDVSGLKGDVSVLKGDVSDLKGDVSVLKGDVSDLKEDVSVLKEDVSVLKRDVHDIKERMAEQHGVMMRHGDLLKEILLRLPPAA